MCMHDEYYHAMNGGSTGAPHDVLWHPSALCDWYSMLDMGDEL